MSKPFQCGENDIETIKECPVCGDVNYKVVHHDVEDWTFGAVAGKWKYNECIGCSSLFINPRIKREKISLAYGQYYTHSDVNDSGLMQKLENEVLYHWLGVEQGNRFNSKFSFFFRAIKSVLFFKHPLIELIKLPVGSVLDVGCGNGKMLEILQKLGWEVNGVEFDDKAAFLVNEKGINVKVGDYRVALLFNGKFDCVIASHVIEHVYDPNDFINTLLEVTKKSGHVFLTYPNSKSILHTLFGKYWRGLEAPRHISLPSLYWVKSLLDSKGHQVYDTTSSLITFWGSYKIKFKRSTLFEGVVGKLIQTIPSFLFFKKRTDIVQLHIIKRSDEI